MIPVVSNEDDWLNITATLYVYILYKRLLAFISYVSKISIKSAPFLPSSALNYFCVAIIKDCIQMKDVDDFGSRSDLEIDWFRRKS